MGYGCGGRARCREEWVFWGDTVTDVFVLLPPSETKATGGNGPPLDLEQLRFPELTGPRTMVIESLTALCIDVERARRALSVGPGKDAEIAATAGLRAGPTLPALQRYTGVLYEALDVAHLPSSALARAADRLLVTSALFGVIGAADRVPAYRYSAGSTIPGFPRPAAFWRPYLTGHLTALERPVLDLRSGAYTGFARLPGAVTVRVLSEDSAGRRSIVSHTNKAAKGRLARALVITRAELTGITAVIRVAARAGLRVERTGERSLDIISPARRPG